jgi:tetratricopeptide (TPR) repeat protein
LTESAIDNQQLIARDVVGALTGDSTGGNRLELRALMERAATEFDNRTADAFGRCLLDSLTEDPANLGLLEALVVLGLAHPEALRRHQISLVVEGRRLAVLLERQGDQERARSLLELLAGRLPKERTIDQELAGILRRSGNTEELIERYLKRAGACVDEGQISEAIPWLQEILLLDRSRRDVARMIRDLRYQEAEKVERSARRTRMIGLLVVVTALITAVVGREVSISRELGQLPQVEGHDPETLYSRLAGLDEIIEANTFWFGMIGPCSERDELREEQRIFEDDQARVARKAEVERQRMMEMAEAARLRALMNFDRGDYDKALADFRRSHSLSTPGWEHRPRLEANIEALEDLLNKEEQR